MSSCVASCCTCFQVASTGSGTTGCWPTAVARPAWPWPASCCASRPLQSGRTTVATSGSSSRGSFAGTAASPCSSCRPSRVVTRSGPRPRSRRDEHHAHSKPDADAARCAAGWASSRLPPLDARRPSSWHLANTLHQCRRRHQLLPRRQVEHRHQDARATGPPQITIAAKRPSNH